jgi:hypothetical protein
VTAGTYEYQSEPVRHYVLESRTQGRAEGEAKAVLAFLDARGIDILDTPRTHITECTAIDLLDLWVRRAATAESICSGRRRSPTRRLSRSQRRSRPALSALLH